MALRRTVGTSTEPADGLAEATAAAGCANGITSGRQTVPAGGTWLVSRWRLTRASMHDEANSEV
jgi:hypothetical protein